MPTKKTPKPQTQSVNNGFRGFINIYLTEDLKATIKSKPFSPDTFEEFLHQKHQDGFKFTFSYDDYQHCYQVIGTKQDKDDPDFGILLTGRGSSPSKAFKQWLFMQTEIIGETPWSEMLKPSNPGEYDD